MSVAVNFGPQDVCPTVWARVLDSGKSGGEALADCYELLMEMVDYLELTREIDDLVSLYLGDLKAINYYSGDHFGRPPRGQKEDALIGVYAPKLFKLGLDPHQVASALRIPLRRLAAILSCNGLHNRHNNTGAEQGYEPTLALLAYDLLAEGRMQSQVARQLGLTHQQVKRLATIYALRKHDPPRPEPHRNLYRDEVEDHSPDLRLLQGPTPGASLYLQSMEYLGSTRQHS